MLGLGQQAGRNSIEIKTHVLKKEKSYSMYTRWYCTQTTCGKKKSRKKVGGLPKARYGKNATKGE